MMAAVDNMRLLAALFLIAYPLQAAGDVMSIETTGASSRTARQDGLRNDGVDASHTMAQTDLGRMNSYKTIIKRVGNDKGVDPAIIAGIISRESRAGNAIKDSRPKPGWGDNNNAFGLMQVDKRYHTPTGSWNSEAHIGQGTEILVQMIGRMQNKFPRWSREKQLKGAIAAYNAGAGNVRTYERMDVGTTGGDYSSDVVARAQYYKGQGY